MTLLVNMLLTLVNGGPKWPFVSEHVLNPKYTLVVIAGVGHNVNLSYIGRANCVYVT